MGLGRVFTLLCAGLLSITAAEPLLAAPKAASPPATAAIRIGRPVTMVWVRDLDFATLTVTTAGTATIDPDDDSMGTTGGVQRISGSPTAARFQVAASRFAILFITLPNAPVTLTRVSGTETMTVSNWTMDGGGLRLIGANGLLDVAVGGRLNVAANQRDGVYTGTFNVNVDYF